jgi:nitrite reductase (cytochrome c-552)
MNSSSTPVGRNKWFYATVIGIVAVATVAVMLLMENIAQRKEEAKQHVFKVVEITEDTIDPAVWGKNYPRQYDGYKRTVDIERTKHGGSEAFQKLEDDPRWREIFKGYAFGVDYREERGHAYMLSDQDMTERLKIVKQPGACLHCHSAVIPAYRQAGVQAGVAADESHRQEQIMKGFELVCGMPYAEARKLVSSPVSCGDCHDPNSMQLRVTRPGFLNGIRALANSDQPTPHLPSIERWRQDGRKTEYDVNNMATRQEMRSFVCGQCHVEYYFKGEGKLLTYPWHNGIKVEQIETYYNEVGHKDWLHKSSGAPVLKAQHPEFEMWSQGIHARSGVACADCHMPYKREGAIKVSDHHVRSPLLNVSNACQTCHHFSEIELRARVEAIQDRTKTLMLRAEDAVVALIGEIQQAQQAGKPTEQLKAAQELQRKAQWRLDFVAAENSMGFHASQETARILGEAIDYAGQGQVIVLKLDAK